MDITQLAEQVLAQAIEGKGEKHGKKNGDRRHPDVRFNVTKDVQAAVWEATHRKTGDQSLFYQVSRLKGDERLLTLRAEDLIANASALAALAKGFAEHEAVDPRLQRELSLFAQGFGQLVLPQTGAIGASSVASDPFADVRVDS